VKAKAMRGKEERGNAGVILTPSESREKDICFSACLLSKTKAARPEGEWRLWERDGSPTSGKGGYAGYTYVTSNLTNS